MWLIPTALVPLVGLMVLVVAWPPTSSPPATHGSSAGSAPCPGRACGVCHDRCAVLVGRAAVVAPTIARSFPG